MTPSSDAELLSLLIKDSNSFYAPRPSLCPVPGVGRDDPRSYYGHKIPILGFPPPGLLLNRPVLVKDFSKSPYHRLFKNSNRHVFDYSQYDNLALSKKYLAELIEFLNGSVTPLYQFLLDRQLIPTTTLYYFLQTEFGITLSDSPEYLVSYLGKDKDIFIHGLSVYKFKLESLYKAKYRFLLYKGLIQPDIWPFGRWIILIDEIGEDYDYSGFTEKDWINGKFNHSYLLANSVKTCSF
jgi:hypothetical protein